MASAIAEKKDNKMEYRFLGKSGLKVSVLSLGAWTTWGNTVSDDDAFACMKAAYDAGCNFFDNAEAYAAGKAETTMGKCIKRLNVDRSELVISTKVFWGGSGPNQRGLSRKHVIEGCEASLKRLQLDYVDCFFAHRPDSTTPIEETVRAMNYLLDKGKIMYWGTSEWSAEQLMEAHHIAQRLGLVGPVMEQPQYNMFHRTRLEKEYARCYAEFGLGTTIWSPLASGLLTGKYSSTTFPEGSRLANASYKAMKDALVSGEGLNGLEEKNFDSILKRLDQLLPVAKRLQCTLPQLALAWTLTNPHVSTCITGASKVEQVMENMKAMEVLPKLTTEVRAEIETILANKPAPPKATR